MSRQLCADGPADAAVDPTSSSSLQTETQTADVCGHGETKGRTGVKTLHHQPISSQLNPSRSNGIFTLCCGRGAFSSIGGRRGHPVCGRHMELHNSWKVCFSLSVETLIAAPSVCTYFKACSTDPNTAKPSPGMLGNAPQLFSEGKEVRRRLSGQNPHGGNGGRMARPRGETGAAGRAGSETSPLPNVSVLSRRSGNINNLV